jgi:outer membrane murein-binding lipoprotein Lpp
MAKGGIPMMESIITAIITGGLALTGVVVTSLSGNKKIETQLMTNQAVTNAKIESLTEEVKKHNSFGDRITRLETKVELLEGGR